MQKTTSPAFTCRRNFVKIVNILLFVVAPNSGFGCFASHSLICWRWGCCWHDRQILPVDVLRDPWEVFVAAFLATGLDLTSEYHAENHDRNSHYHEHDSYDVQSCLADDHVVMVLCSRLHAKYNHVLSVKVAWQKDSNVSEREKKLSLNCRTYFVVFEDQTNKGQHPFKIRAIKLVELGEMCVSWPCASDQLATTFLLV